MKFRSRMILAYTLVAFLVSLALGVVVGQNSLRYETESQKRNLLISAKSYVSQMEECLGRMDAIMQYILSNASMLDSITLLAQTPEETVSVYKREAESTIRVGISTSYIMKNSYRTVFFNEKSFLASSAIYTPDAAKEMPSSRLNTDFRLEDIPYLDDVTEASGKPVIVTAHLDTWGDRSNVSVFSLVKALRGEDMGFLEVENRMDSLELLEKSDEDIRFLLIVNGGSLLYASDKDYGEELTDKEHKIFKDLEEDTVLTESGDIYAKASSKQFDLTVLAYKQESLLEGGKRRIFIFSFFAAMAVFGTSLIFIIIFSNILTRPMKRLQKVVESTNIENLQDNWSLEEAGASDEFQELIHSFQTMTARLNTAMQNEKKAAMLQLQAQFDTLQTQVNPHFVYNVLNIISSHAVMDNDEVICEMCGSLGNMLRYSTNNKERYAPVEKEIEYLNSYFYLLKARYEDRLEVSMDIDRRIGKEIIPKMTLQQLVENSVKHGFHDTDVQMHISLTGKVLDDGWIIEVRDNGSGIRQEALEEIYEKLSEVRKEILERAMPVEMEIGEMGIANTYARCLLLYFEDLIFEIKNLSDEKGFVVTVGCKNMQRTGNPPE